MSKFISLFISEPIKKASLVLSLICFISVGSSVFGQTLAYVGQQQKRELPTVSMPKARALSQVFNELKEHYGVTFMYEDRVLAGKTLNGTITYEPKIEKTLDLLLKPIGLKYKRIKAGTYVITDNRQSKEGAADSFFGRETTPVAPSDASLLLDNGFGTITPSRIEPVSQPSVTDVPVKGKITDEAGNGLPGANITIKGTTRGTSTAADGGFSIDVPDKNATLVVSYIGYLPQEIKIGSQTFINLRLSADDKTLGEVVVIGYGERSRRDVTGAISSIKAEEIAKSNYVAPEMAMQGRMTGVQVTQGSGAPNARPQVRIRGVGTFGNTEPLYVIDGVPITEQYNGITDGAAGDIRGNVNILTMINPSDIESVSVLKDAAASAVYGVQAAHGVVLITTKRGKTGRPRVEINASKGVQNIRKLYDMMNVQQNVGLINEAYANNKDEAKNLPAEFNAKDPKYLGNRPTVDWVTPAINRNAVVEDYSARVSGGTEATKYYVSGGYSRTESPLIQNYLERFTVAANIDSKVSKYLSMGLNYRNSYTKALDNTQTDIGYLSGTTPWQSIYDPNGPGGFAPAYNVTFKRNDKFVATDLTSGSAFDLDKTEPLWGPETNANPYAWHQLNQTDYSIIGNIANAYLQLEPIAGLKIKGMIGVNWFYNRRNDWGDFNSYLFSQTPGNPYAGHDGTSKGSYGERHTRNLNLIKELSANYNRAFGEHLVDVLVVANQQQNSYEFISGSTGQVVSNDPLFRTNIGGPVQYTNSGAFRDREALIGYLGRLSYNYKSKYYLDATIRRDGSSKFAPGFKWGIFPGVSAAWRISAEKFMEQLPIVNDLKLRAGWGQLGNQRTAAFAFLSTVSTTPDYAFGSGAGNGVGTVRFGASLPDFPNRNLSWETAETINIGLDGALLNNSITFTIEYYNKLTKGILQSTAIPASVGNERQPIINIASVRNSGIELQLGANKKLGNLTLSASANLTTVKNNVVSVFKDQAFGGEGGRIEVGYPLNYLWGYKMAGIFQNQAEIDTWKAKYKDGNNNSNFAPGDAYFEDVKGSTIGSDPDNTVNADDRSFIGKTIPGYYYGLNLGANWKNLDVSIFFQGVGDVVRYNWERAGGEGMGGPGNNYWTSTLNRWTPQNPSTTMPRAVRSDPAQNGRFSTRFVESAAFLRLKNVQIGYTLPKTLTRKLGGMENCRVYFSATNLLTFTKWSGLDPESFGTIPPTQSTQLGINIGF